MAYATATSLPAPPRRTARTERARTDGHAGLGLALVHGIVRAHDGTPGLAPRPGGGPSVTVRLPVEPS
ncbi:ATP-binding protein [Streptomyces sp. NPDC048018]|uniref:ATP-binding protein n=1 Tax=Streptomyces sp. NPDC048018 TaxID=3365499 RepID=UPI0037152651